MEIVIYRRQRLDYGEQNDTTYIDASPKTAVTQLLTHWSYCSLAPNHWYIPGIQKGFKNLYSGDVLIFQFQVPGDVIIHHWPSAARWEDYQCARFPFPSWLLRAHHLHPLRAAAYLVRVGYRWLIRNLKNYKELSWSSSNTLDCRLQGPFINGFTHLLDKMAAFSQMVFLWMQSFVFWLKFHWSLFLRVQLTITQHWFR